MTDTDLRQRAREIIEALFPVWGERNGPVSRLCRKGEHDWCTNRGPDETHCGCQCHKDKREKFVAEKMAHVEAALRAVQQETEQLMKVQRALAWEETAKRIAAIDTLTEEREALRIRCATPLVQRVAQMRQELEKRSEWSISCDPMKVENAHWAIKGYDPNHVFALLDEAISALRGPNCATAPETQLDIARKEEWEGRS